MHEMKRRLLALEPLRSKVDAVAIFSAGNDPNFFYFTNSSVSGIFYYDFEEPALLTNQMEISRAKKESWIKHVETADKKQIEKKLKGRIGIDKKRLSVAESESIKARKIDVSFLLNSARAIKSKYEQEKIRKACSIAVKVYGKVKGEKNLTEMEMKGLAEMLMHRYGAVPAFSSIVASGSNVKFPHHEPEPRKISSPLLIDLGARYQGYCSDITRTEGSSFSGVLKKAFEEIEGMLGPGIKCSDLDTRARSVLGRHSKYFIHSLGHGIGIDVHENPTISGKSEDTLKPGMVIAIEPGIYASGGGRHEEDYLITGSGFQKLT